MIFISILFISIGGLMNRTIIETLIFIQLVDGEKDKGLLDRIKAEILKDPEKGDLIKGSGGLRKIRLAKDGKGKSGGYRLIYLDIPSKKRTYLLLLYSKNVIENISPEQLNILKSISKDIKNEK
jgi:hypothetical protein